MIIFFTQSKFQIGKVLLIVLLIFNISVTKSQYVILSENFDNTTLGSTTCTATCPAPTNWSQATSDDKDWCAHSGSTVSSNTGPTGDHTSGSGKYMYIEASSCYNKRADLITPSMNFSYIAPVYLKFWYHMYGSTIDSLHIDISTDAGVSWKIVFLNKLFRSGFRIVFY